MKKESNITNIHDLPEEIYKALCSDNYSGDVTGKKTDYSATSLVAPVQQTILKKRYPNIQAEDVMDRVWALLGSGVHNIIEGHASEGAVVEKRLYKKVLDKTLSGQVDHYKDGVITDYKVTTSFKVCKGDYSDWEKQLNIYAWLFKQHKYKVNSLRIISFIRDHSESNKFKSGYPNFPITVIPITLWEDHIAESFIKDKVATLKACEDYTDEQLPPCSDDDMWAQPDVWAVMKEGRKSAIKLFDNLDSAREHAGYMSDEAGNALYIQHRKGERRRCSKYCTVSSVCSQYKKYLEDIGSQDD